MTSLTSSKTEGREGIDEKNAGKTIKKLAEKFGGLKERRTFAPAIEKATMVVER